jgi:PAS domain S-box-containing protein
MKDVSVLPVPPEGSLNGLVRLIVCGLLCLAAMPVHAAPALETIVLQLPWHHQFQFAGYYAAIEQGYYREAGLDVSVNSIRPSVDAVEEVVSGRAQYGVARGELLLYRLHGKPVVALATIFQHSAVIMLARQDSGIRSPRDMIGRRVMLRKGDSAAEYIATFKSVGVSLDQVQVLPASYDVQDLVDGKTDVLNAYITNEPFILEERNIPSVVIRPIDYGVDFYGDTLFTSESELASHPDRIKAFREASIRGWEYALSHREEIINLLIEKYGVEKSRAHLRYEANAMDKLILPDLVPLGQMLDKRWQKMAETYVQLGMVQPGYSLENFLYTPPAKPDYSRLRLPAAIMAVCLVLMYVITLLVLNRRLRRSVSERTRELEENAKMFRAVYDNMDSGVAIYEPVDQGGDFIFKDLNPAGCRYSQVRREDILHKSVREVFPGVEALGLFAVFQRVWRSGEAESLPVSTYQDDRITLYVENHVSRLPSGEIIAVYSDLTEKTEAERKQSFYQKRLEALWHLSTMLGAGFSDICHIVLQELVSLTGSKYGFYGLVDKDEQVLSVTFWSQQVLADCQMEQKSAQFTMAGSEVWGSAVRAGMPLINNTYRQDDAEKKGGVAGHVAISRLLSIPVRIGGRIVAVAAVANKGTDYCEDDATHAAAFLQSAQIVIDRKQHELALVEAREEWRKSFDAIPDLVTIEDRDMRIVRANRSAEQFFNVQPGGLAGRYCYELFCGCNEPCPACPREKVLKNNRKTGSTEVTNEKLGKIFLISYSAIDDESGRSKYYIFVTRDVTDQKRLEEELFQTQKQEAVGTLAGGIAHDFNNILGAILGYAELAKQGLAQGTPARKDVDQIINAGRRATTLVQQILDFSRKAQQHRQPVEPVLLVREALQMLRAILSSTIEIQEEIDPGCGFILADPTKFHQVVMNLCTNAFHAMADEKGILRVTLSRRDGASEGAPLGSLASASFVVLAVSDTGCGMTPETISHIFDPFYTTKEKGKGTGLGLAVAHGIIKGYDGTIEVESKPGQGSTFRVWIPVMDEAQGLPAQPEPVDTISLAGTERILVVDDEEFLVKLNQRILEDHGYTVTGITDSSKALELVRSDPGQFDLIVTDQTMPGLTGIELAGKVLEVDPAIPVILCTGHSEVATEQDARGLGIKKYLHKPLQGDELARAVRMVLDERKTEGQKDSSQ